jgi:N-formylglutamate amidohydrolase
MDIIISIPHSSTVIPDKFKSQFSQPVNYLNKHIDFGVDKIINFDKYPIIKAEVSRFVADVNRERNDTESNQGVIINKDWNNKPVLLRNLTKKEIDERLVYYDKFHKKLISLLKKGSFLLDCHSMDSKNHSEKTDRPDICLANSFGKTCPKEITDLFKFEFEKNSFWVEENNPYSGSRAKIINLSNTLYVPSLELEFNKNIYMDEESFELNHNSIKKLRQVLQSIFDKIEKL